MTATRLFLLSSLLLFASGCIVTRAHPHHGRSRRTVVVKEVHHHGPHCHHKGKGRGHHKGRGHGHHKHCKHHDD
jgi:hypothetical protein